MLNTRRLRAAPGSFAGDATRHCGLYVHTQLHQAPDFGTRLAPLSPVGHPNAAADPVIQIAATLIAGGDTKVVDPAPKVLADLEKLVVHRHTPVPVRQFPDTLLELAQRVRVPMDLGSLEGKAQELAVIGSDHPALGSVDRQFQAMFEEVADAGQHPVARTTAVHHNGEVVRVAGKPMAPPFQFFIQRIEHDVGQQRRQWATLRNTFPTLQIELVVDNPSSQIPGNQSQQTLVPNLAAKVRHQQVVIDPVEELRQVHIHGKASPFLENALYPSHRLLVFRLNGNEAHIRSAHGFADGPSNALLGVRQYRTL